MAFFFKVFPEIIEDGRLFIAEPPLYRVSDKNNPFVVNKADYNNRYAKAVAKDYSIGYQVGDDDPEYMDKETLIEFLTSTSSYVDEMNILIDHYKTNGILLEIILGEFADMDVPMNDFVATPDLYLKKMIKQLNIQILLDRIREEFPEMNYDDKHKLFRGIIDGKFQSIEVTEAFVRRCREVIKIIHDWGVRGDETLILRDRKTKSEHRLSLLGILRMLKKYQPAILHRFKGLGENDYEDIKTTIMDPNTRTLIRVNIADIENDMKIFNILRGSSPIDALNRKQMISEYKIDKSLIDT